MTDGAPSQSITIEDRTVDGPHGAIPVRIYLRPSATQGLVWAHGGAFAFGSLDDPESDWVARQLAERGIAVVTVDYRLAPISEWAAAVTGAPVTTGVHFPVPSEEVGFVFTWATALLPEIPASQWSLGGASAGANLSAGAALRLRDAQHALPRTLLLAYGLFHSELPVLRPELKERYENLPSESPGFSPEMVQMINLNYVGEPAQLAAAYAFPGGHDLQDLPPTFLINAEHDSLRASGELFGSELAAAGVDVLMVREHGTVHGHFSTPEQPGASRSIERIMWWLTSDTLTAEPS